MKKVMDTSEYPVADLPTIDISNCTSEDLEKLVKLGMCYIDISKNQNTSSALAIVRAKALSFFHQSSAEKTKKLFSESADRSGYLDHTTNTRAGYAEQCIFDPNKPMEYFSEVKSSVVDVSDFFTQDVGYALIMKLMKHLNIRDAEDKYQQMIQGNNFIFNIIFYPSSDKTDSTFGLKPHKDFYPYISILSPGAEPGLQINIGQQWYAVGYKPGHLLVVIGQPLEMILGHQCVAPVHRVCVPKNERLTCGLSIDPCPTAPMFDYTTGEKLFDSTKEFLDKKVGVFYEESAEESVQNEGTKPIQKQELNVTIAKFSHKYASPIHTQNPTSNNNSNVGESDTAPKQHETFDV